MKAFVLALVASLVFLPGAQAAEKVKVCTLSTILTELAQKVGGDRVEVIGLVKPGIDPHEYEPAPSDLQLVAQSQLILASGKHMEGYLTKLKESAGGSGDLVPVGDRFASLTMKPEEGGKQGEAKEIEDPHWWHSVDNVERATKVVRDELEKLSPADKAVFDKNADAYIATLEELKGWIKRKVAELPRDQRKLVTSHDAFQYFARDYGFTIYAIEGVSTEDEPSNRKVAEIIDTIKKQNVKAIFLESIENPKVLKVITRETGARIGGSLYADGLGLGADGTYDGMMRHNVTTIVNALK
jgi:ABC-type Zn uptake system ZnuABC Zn-binding protein ZnuA